MKTRFFHTLNANRPFKSQGFTFQFEPYEFQSGKWHGVLKTEDEEEAKVLDELTKSTSIQSIDEDDYDSAIKKKLTPNTTSSSPAPGSTSPQPSAAESPKPVTNFEEVLVTGRIESSETMDSDSTTQKSTQPKTQKRKTTKNK